MKKIIGLIVVLVGVFALVGCVGDDKDVKVSEKDIFALSAVGGVSDINIQRSNNMLRDSIDLGYDNIHHLELMLSLMNEKAYSSEVVESDKAEYENLLVSKVNGEEFKFYYNETLVKHELEEDEDETEEKSEYIIKGIIINNDLGYQVIGEKTIEIEVEEDENSEEMELELLIRLDDENYSIIKYEIENETEEEKSKNERELVFETYINDELVSEMEIEIENEDNKNEINFKLKEAGNTYSYKFKNKNNKEAVIEYVIKTSENTTKGKINVTIVVLEDGTIDYQF